jgi:hypothetical protein
MTTVDDEPLISRYTIHIIMEPGFKRDLSDYLKYAIVITLEKVPGVAKVELHKEVQA